MTEGLPPTGAPVDGGFPAGMDSGFPPPAIEGFDKSFADVARNNLQTPGVSVEIPAPRVGGEVISPERAILKKGESIVLDGNRGLFRPGDFGFPPRTSAEAPVATIPGTIDILSTAKEGEIGVPILQMAVMRVQEQLGGDSWYLVPPMVDGKRAPSIKLPINTKLTIGRESSSNAGNPTLIGDTRLGIRLPSVVSRNHATIELTPEGVKIESSSDAMTQVVGVRKPTKDIKPVAPTQQDDLPIVLKGDPKLLITTVPQTGADAKADMGKRASDIEAQKQARVDAQVDRIVGEMEAIQKQLSEADGHALWKFASGTVNVEDYGRDPMMRQEASNQGIVANEGLRAMSPQALAVRDRYLSLMRSKAHLLRSE